MSFSKKIKEELALHTGSSRHCQLAELAAIFYFLGRVSKTEDGIGIRFENENEPVHRKIQILLQELFAENEQCLKEGSRQILEALKIWDEKEQCLVQKEVVDGLLIQQVCCKRAFIRGAFLSAGSMSDPKKGYHFEIVCDNEPGAKQLQEVMNVFEVDAKIVRRKKSFVVYVKEGAHIVDLLNVMEAHVALMELENIRILKEMRNSVNRKVNCETANISKTVSASLKQIEAIEYIKEHGGFDQLPDTLKEVAMLRLQYPEAPLKELGGLLDTPVGKSGVNHRLRKIGEIAEEMGAIL